MRSSFAKEKNIKPKFTSISGKWARQGHDAGVCKNYKKGFMMEIVKQVRKMSGGSFVKKRKFFPLQSVHQ